LHPSSVLPWRRRPALGCWSHIPGSFAAEVLLSAPFDWWCIDRQHGMVDEAALLGMLQIAGARGMCAFVRTTGQDPAEIGRALDMGADGVIVPMVHEPAQAEAVAAACRFPPEGTRSWGPTRRRMSPPLADPAAQNRATACFVMVESRQGLENVEAIAAAPGVDGIFLGPGDLGLALGDAGSVPEAAAAIVAACSAHGKVAGVFGGGLAATQNWRARGFTFIALQSDSALLADAARDLLDSARALGDAEEP
jgi:4-hydroxy-2-oxoheptanedioate aldolase